MLFVHHPDVTSHRPPAYFNRGLLRTPPESPERVTALTARIEALGHRLIHPADHGPAARAAVHTPAYLTYLETAHARWIAGGDMGEVVLPNVSRMARDVSYPTGVVGQTGWHMFDTAAPIVADTWKAACAAADAAVEAAELVMDGKDRTAYALCRPPGHHARRDQAGGFCYLNNVAIAAEVVLAALRVQGRSPRVAIIDVDVHHGNGTQDIFYQRDDVFFVSIHGDPHNFYPHMTGYAHERGAGRGEGYNLNLPLPIGSEEDAVMTAVARGLEAIGRYAPEVLLVSLGFDTYIADPLAAFGVTTPGFARLGALLGGPGLPTVLVQEGGYDVAALPENFTSFLDGFNRQRV